MRSILALTMNGMTETVDLEVRKTFFGVWTSDEALLVYLRKNDNREDVLRKEAEVQCRLTSSGSLACVAALSTVVKRVVYSYYPNCGRSEIVHCFNCKFLPRNGDQTDGEAIHVLWSRDGNFDNHPRATYYPNHFVPLFKVYISRSGERERDSKSKISPVEPKCETSSANVLPSSISSSSNTLTKKPTVSTALATPSRPLGNAPSVSSCLMRFHV